jgi:hypothetical protein
MNALGERLLPYIVTAFFAGVGWAVTQSVERFSKSPVIEYDREIRTADRGQSLVVTLRNPSHDRSFKRLMLIFLIQDGGEILGARVIPKPPAWEGNEQPLVSTRSAKFELPELNPGWEIGLLVRFGGGTPPTFSLATSDPTARLLEPPSVELFLINHHFKIIVGTLLLWAGILAWLVGKRRARRQRKSAVAASK